MWIRSDLKERAKQTFKKFYWKCVIVGFIAMLVGGGLDSGAWRINNNIGNSNQTQNYQIDSNDFDNGLYQDPEITSQEINGNISNGIENFISTGFFALFLGIGLVVSLIVFVIKLLVTYPIQIGKNNYFMGIRREEKSLDSLILIYKSGFLKETVITMFCKGLFQFLWSLLFVIPGIIKSYEYRMIPYILSENPQITRKRAFELSKTMMRGNKWKTFVLDLSFIGWYILSGITLGIVAIFYVIPYVESTNAELYAYLREEALNNGSAKPTELIGF